MRTKVTENGVFIPKGWLEGIDEVDIQKAQNMIILLAFRTSLERVENKGFTVCLKFRQTQYLQGFPG